MNFLRGSDVFHSSGVFFSGLTLTSTYFSCSWLIAIFPLYALRSLFPQVFVNILSKNLLHPSGRRRTEIEVNHGMGYFMRKYPVSYIFEGDVNSLGPVGIKCNWRLTHDAHPSVSIFKLAISLIQVYAEMKVRRVHIQYRGYLLNYPVYPVFYQQRIFLRVFAEETEPAFYVSGKAVKLFIARIVYCGILCFVGFFPFLLVATRLYELSLKGMGIADKEKKPQIKADKIWIPGIRVFWIVGLGRF
mgnify:FL=1